MIVGAFIGLCIFSFALYYLSDPWHEEYECVGLDHIQDADKGDLECIYIETHNETRYCYYCNKRIKVWVRE